jgi:hypothetical protein
MDIHFIDQYRDWFKTHYFTGHSPDFTLFINKGLLRREDIQILLFPASKIPVISKGETKKIERGFGLF